MSKPTDLEVERAADAIKFMVPSPDGSRWTDKGRAEVKWPRDFSADEQKTIRAIARVALTTKAGEG